MTNILWALLGAVIGIFIGGCLGVTIIQKIGG